MVKMVSVISTREQAVLTFSKLTFEVQVTKKWIVAPKTQDGLF